jgi:hypothetical protein
LAKSNYKSNKRHKELERKKKQDQKRQRKQDKSPLKSNGHLNESQNKEET